MTRKYNNRNKKNNAEGNRGQKGHNRGKICNDLLGSIINNNLKVIRIVLH